jgi:hypothetical protein
MDYKELISYLSDPGRVETKRMWDAVLAGELDPEQRAQAQALAPAVTRYLSKETDREQYEAEIGALADEWDRAARAAEVPQP